MDDRELWLALVADADLSPGSSNAHAVTETVRRVIGVTPGDPLAPAVLADPRTSGELFTAYMDDWRARHGGRVAA